MQSIEANKNIRHMMLLLESAVPPRHEPLSPCSLGTRYFIKDSWLGLEMSELSDIEAREQVVFSLPWTVAAKHK